MKKGKYIFLLIFPIMILLIVNPEIYVASALSGLKLFVFNVLPALLPFFFFTRILTAVGSADTLSNKGGRIFTALFGAHPISAYVFVMSVMSGYPVGAKLVSDLHRDGIISDYEAKKIIPFTSAAGSMFTVGAIGVALMHSKSCGFIILFCHYAALILNGFLYRGRTKSKLLSPPVADTDNLLYEASYSSVVSILLVGLYITIMYVVTDMLNNTGIMSLICAPLRSVTDDTFALGVVSGILEMTRGTVILSECEGILVLPAITAIVSFGGVSVTLQSMAFLGSCKIKASYYLLTKLTQSVLAFGICLAYCLIFM